MVYAVSQHPDMEYKLAVTLTPEGYSPYIPNVHTIDDLSNMGEKMFI